MSGVTAPARVAFLGLGVMGYPMAGHLVRAGYAVQVFNRTSDVADRFAREHAATAHATPAATVANCDVVFMCLGNDDSVRDVVLARDGVLAGMAAGAVLVDHTTASATLARELDQACREQAAAFVDAPVSGGEVGAQTGALSIMAGGADAAFARVDSVWQCYAKLATHIGPAGSGQLAKMVNQVCIAGVLQGLSEGIALLEATGLSGDKVFAAIGGGAAASWQMHNRAETMLKREFEFGFAVDWMRKDLGLALGEAERHAVELPLTRQVDARYAQIQEQGGARYDTSSLLLAFDVPSLAD